MSYMGQVRTAQDIPGTSGTWDYGFVYIGQLEIVHTNPRHVCQLHDMYMYHL